MSKDLSVITNLPSSMAPSILSSSLRLIRLISTFKSPISCGRMIMSSSTTVSGPSPCLMLPPIFEGFGGNMVYNFYDLAQNKVISFNNNKIPENGTKIVGSSHGWLALFDELNNDLILTNPVTRRHVKLPPSKRVSKVIISCEAEQDECQAMMIDDYCALSFCRPGRSPTEWTPIDTLKRSSYYSTWRRYEDLVYSSRHKLFFCVTKIEHGDDLEGWDVASDPPRLRWENRDDLVGLVNYDPCLGRAGELLDANAIELLEDNEGLWCETVKYLVFVEQADRLFIVMRHFVRQMAPNGSTAEDLDNDIYPYKTVAFDVYRIDWELEGEGATLIHVDGGSLGGVAMFVGLNHSFAVSAYALRGQSAILNFPNDDQYKNTPITSVAMNSDHYASSSANQRGEVVEGSSAGHVIEFEYFDNKLLRIFLDKT